MYKYILVCSSTNNLVPFLDFHTLLGTRQYKAFPLNPVYLKKTAPGSTKPSNYLVLPGTVLFRYTRFKWSALNSLVPEKHEI